MLICAIPECSASQIALQTGNLHLIDTLIDGALAGTPQSRKKYVWVCSDCSKTHVVQIWRPAGDQIRRRQAKAPLPFPVQAETAKPGRLLLMQNAS